MPTSKTQNTLYFLVLISTIGVLLLPALSQKTCKTNEKLWTHINGTAECTKTCPKGWKSAKDESGQAICIPKCSGELISYFPSKDTCYRLCPPGTEDAIVSETDFCQLICPSNKYLLAENNNKCVASCTDGWTGYTSADGIKLCKPTCTGATPIWFAELNQCVSQCPPYWSVITEFTRMKCSKPCKGALNLWVNNGIQCPKNCPSGWKPVTDEGGQAVCTNKCTGELSIYFSLQDTCVYDCPTGTTETLENRVYVCKAICPSTKYLWAENDNKCVTSCSDGWTGYTTKEGINICRLACTSNTPIWSAQLNQCVDKCPSGWPVITELTRQKCSKPCKGTSSRWIDDSGRANCVETCPSGWKSIDGESGQTVCTKKCAGELPLYFSLQDTCVDSCPTGTIEGVENRVVHCELICPTTQYFFEYDGNVCVESCPEAWNGATQNGVKICIPKRCPPGWREVTENGRNGCKPP